MVDLPVLRDLTANSNGVALGTNDVRSAPELFAEDIIIRFSSRWGAPLGVRFRILAGEAHNIFVILMLPLGLPALIKGANDSVAHFGGCAIIALISVNLKESMSWTSMECRGRWSNLLEGVEGGAGGEDVVGGTICRYRGETL